MSSPAAALRPRRRTAPLTSAEARERWIRRRVCITWGLLVLNVLTFVPKQSIIPIPSAIGKSITQGALQLALIMALTVNRKALLRPNVFLGLVSLLVVGAVMSTMQSPHVGGIYRVVRLAEFVFVLFLLSPWWGRRDLLLVRCHLTLMSIVLGSVLLGLLVAPSRARVSGRLSGAIWPIPATQVAHYAAVTMGLVIIFWLCGNLRGRVTLFVVVISGAVLLLTHTRTALAAMITGLVLAGLSLVTAKARVRKFFAWIGAVVAIVAMTLASVVTTWLARGQNSHELSNLTGRTEVWGQVVSLPRDKFEEIFGFGLSSTSFNGLPIDSNWLASYVSLGLFGVAVCVAMLVFLLVSAYFQPRGLHRALALFLVGYCVVASFTEVAFTEASPYLLELALAASLLLPSLRRVRRPELAPISAGHQVRPGSVRSLQA